MKLPRIQFGVACSVLALTAFAKGDERGTWPHWRGPLGTGVAPHADPPVEWSDRDRRNIRWKVE
jgi:hypothetical protein